MILTEIGNLLKISVELRTKSSDAGQLNGRRFPHHSMCPLNCLATLVALRSNRGSRCPLDTGPEEGRMHRVKSLVALGFIVLACSLPPSIQGAGDRTDFRFDFGGGKSDPGYAQVTKDMAYSTERGYGFLDSTNIQDVNRGGAGASYTSFCTSDKPFLFAVDLPEGNYNVTVTF